MKLLKSVLFISLTKLLAACNGSADSSDSGTSTTASDNQPTVEQPTLDSNLPQPESTPAPEIKPEQAPDLSGPNGIYFRNNLPVGMVVDLDREHFPVVGLDLVNTVFFMLDDATLEGNTITGVGFSGIRKANDSLEFITERDETKAVRIELGEMQASIAADIDSAPFSYNFTDKTYSIDFDQLVGTHTSADGTEIIIDEAGAVIINSAESSYYCTFEANLNKVGVYYDLVGLKASSCSAPEFDGDYQQGTFITVNDSNGDTFMLSLLIKNPGQLAWGSTQIKEQ